MTHPELAELEYSGFKSASVALVPKTNIIWYRKGGDAFKFSGAVKSTRGKVAACLVSLAPLKVTPQSSGGSQTVKFFDKVSL